MSTAKAKRCKDCVAWWASRGGEPKVWRPAPNKGPRCASHYRDHQKAVSARTHETRMQDVYGLQPGQYRQLYDFQGGTCCICRRATGASRRLSTDHDHRTGYVRMLLCRPCNDMLGHGRDDPEFFRRAARMLEHPPAKHLGIRAIHKDFRKEES